MEWAKPAVDFYKVKAKAGVVNGSTAVPITIGSNIASLRSQRQLFRTNDELSSVFTRLSSGQRINRASDDAAGLAIADSLNADSRVFAQGVRNLNDGLSILNVADGALQELSNITFRLTELAEQAANGVLGKQQREALDEEAQALSDEYFRIVQSTEFNGRTLFTADFGELRLQAGYGLDASIGQGLGGAIGTGEFDDQQTFATSSSPISILTGDFNNDGILDVVNSEFGGLRVSLLLGNGDGSFGDPNSFEAGLGNRTVVSADLNGDGSLDLIASNYGDRDLSILLGNGDGTFQEQEVFNVDGNIISIGVGDFNGDGIIDLANLDRGDREISILLGNGDGSFRTQTDIAIPGIGQSSIEVADLNGDGILDLVNTNENSSSANVILGDGSGSFQLDATYSTGFEPVDLDIGDFNGDGIFDLVIANTSETFLSIRFGIGDGTFGAENSYDIGVSSDTVEIGDFNGDGISDLISTSFSQDAITLSLGNRDGTFVTEGTFSIGGVSGSLTIGDFNSDGVVDIASANRSDNTISVLVARTTDGIAPLLDFSLGTIADARQALSQFTQSLERLSAQRGEIGAFQARIEVAENVLQVTTENFQAAESRIRDADIAQEAADLVRLQILQQSSVAVLGQANLQPQLVLQLLST